MSQNNKYSGRKFWAFLGYIFGLRNDIDVIAEKPASEKSNKTTADWLFQEDEQQKESYIASKQKEKTSQTQTLSAKKVPVRETASVQAPDLGDATPIGRTRSGGDIVISEDDRRKHTYVVGKTGMGKTSLLENMILEDINQGKGVAVIDPHGDLYDKILSQIPKNRTNDVVLFDPSDIEYPVGFNILENTNDQLTSLIASSIVGVFKKIFGHSWGPRLEYILRNATLTLLEHKDTTLLSLGYLLTDENYRKNIIRKTQNPFLKRFWNDEFDALSPARQAEVVSPILNKVGQFLSVPLIRNIVSQPKSSFSPRWVMDKKKIFLANLSKGKIGEDVSEMLGSMLVTKFQLDAMSRASLPAEERGDFYLYVDEFQNFATESFTNILSEARKYGLNLTLAHQYLDQLHPSVAQAIFGNVASIIAFQLGYTDARIMANALGANVQVAHLTDIEKFHYLARLVKNGDETIIISGKSYPPQSLGKKTNETAVEKIRTVSRDKFAKGRDFVEGKLAGK